VVVEQLLVGGVVGLEGSMPCPTQWAPVPGATTEDVPGLVELEVAVPRSAPALR